jgi:hypothetical protein
LIGIRLDFRYDSYEPLPIGNQIDFSPPPL